MKKAAPLVASVLAVVLLVGCVNVGSLITLGTQIVVDILQVIAAFQGQAAPADIAVAQAVGAEAQKDWTDLSAAYTAFQLSKTPSNLANVVAAGTVLENSLPALLADGHIKDQVFATRIEAVVSTLITVVDTIAADLGTSIPVSPATAQFKARRLHLISGQVKAQRDGIRMIWNNTVCAPTGVSTTDAVLAKVKL